MCRRLALFGAILICISPALPASGQSVEVARDYYDHGLNEKAKDQLITAVHAAATTPANKAKALYLLGSIEFDEGHLHTAVLDWTRLAKEYPQTPEGKEISARLVQLSGVVSKVSDETTTSAVASSYISNGDFWSRADRKFTIDTSWLEVTDLGIEWYDRAIKEFPGSDAAELAYQKKMFALIGSHGESRTDEATGAAGNYAKYMPMILQTFSAMAEAFPTNSSLQAFRYQIAQIYWGHKDWTNTRMWLQKIIDISGDDHTFYSEAARARLTKIEY